KTATAPAPGARDPRRCASNGPSADARDARTPADASPGRSRNDTARAAATPKRLQQVAQAASRRPSMNLPARDGANDGFGKRIERDVFGQEPLENRPQQEDAGTVERGLVERDARLQ